MPIHRDLDALQRGGTLLLGVHAWPTSESLRRRRTIRRICASTDAVTVRFIMAQGGTARSRVPHEAPGEDTDILSFPIGVGAPPPKSLHKFLIANAFLRHAAQLDYTFVGRSEDDVLLDVSALGLHLTRLAAVPLLLYGPRGTWVMWDRDRMLPMCWNAHVAHAFWSGRGDCRPAHEGPFLLFQGPLVVYSRALLQVLVALPRFAADATRVATNWSSVVQRRMLMEHIDYPNNPPRLGVVYSGVAEDVHYSAVLAAELSLRELTVVSVPLSEYDWRKVRPAHRLRAAAVFHRLTTWHHLNASGLVTDSPLQQRTGEHNAFVRATPLLAQWWQQSRPPLSRCRSFAERFRPFQAAARGGKVKQSQMAMASKFCCRQWRMCEP